MSDAIERLREDVETYGDAKTMCVDGPDLRALLDSHDELNKPANGLHDALSDSVKEWAGLGRENDRLRAALEQLQRAVQTVCEQGLVEEAGLWLLDLTLEGNNE